jgi:hypothetical protein
MKKNQKIVAGIAAILVAVGIITTAIIIGNNPGDRGHVANDTPDRVCPISEIDGITTVQYSGMEGETALAILKTMCEAETQSSTYGDFVTAIDGREAGTTHYWAFYVNDAYANEGAGVYKTKDGDKITWKLTSLNADY